MNDVTCIYINTTYNHVVVACCVRLLIFFKPIVNLNLSVSVYGIRNYFTVTVVESRKSKIFLFLIFFLILLLFFYSYPLQFTFSYQSKHFTFQNEKANLTYYEKFKISVNVISVK